MSFCDVECFSVDTSSFNAVVITSHNVVRVSVIVYTCVCVFAFVGSWILSLSCMTCSSLLSQC